MLSSKVTTQVVWQFGKVPPSTVAFRRSEGPGSCCNQLQTNLGWGLGSIGIEAGMKMTFKPVPVVNGDILFLKCIEVRVAGGEASWVALALVPA